MFVVIWEYEVRAGAEPAFERLYGPDGDWSGLFRSQAGYIDTELLRDERPRRYLSIDRWRSAGDYAAFLAAEPVRYAAIDARGDALTLDERCIGRYQPTAT